MSAQFTPTYFPAPPPPPTTPPTPWFKRTWVIVVATASVGIGVGAAASTSEPPAPQSTSEYKSLANELDGAENDLVQTRDELGDTKDALDAAQAEVKSVAGDLPDREDAVKKAVKELQAAQRKLDKRDSMLEKAEKAVMKREKAVGVVEQTIADNTIPGDGVYRVGQDMKAGTYRSQDNSDCYWMISSDANGSNILENNIVTGPALVNLSEGTFFTTTRCGDWVLQS